MKSFLLEGKDPVILLSQYHGCWWPGDERGQGINNHGIDLVILKYSSFSARSINTLRPEWKGHCFDEDFMLPDVL